MNNYIFIKRLYDIAIASLVLLILSPLFLIIAIFVKITSPGPLIYKQERVGLKGECFWLYKFRTMIKDAEKYTGPVWATKNDCRVTLLGKILRRTRLDELPQIVNVLKGDMSIVGPRPERPFFVNKHKVLQGIRLSVKPGLTGVAQIEGYYHTHPRNKLRYDYLYIKNQSLLLDAKLTLKTLLIIFTKPGS